MSLEYLSILLAISILIGIAAPPRIRTLALLITSLVVVYSIQPLLPVRNLDFWLPTIAIGLAAIIWWSTQNGNQQFTKRNLFTALIITGVVLSVSGLRYFDSLCCLTPSRPPDIIYTLCVIIGLSAIALGSKKVFGEKYFQYILIGCLLLIFVGLKQSDLAKTIAQMFRSLTGQNPQLATSTDIIWLGYSYMAFRFVHVLRDAQLKQLPNLPLDEFMLFVFFFPAFSAGPIDRVQRFTKDIHDLDDKLYWKKSWFSSPHTINGIQRIAIGLTKKFILADSLAIFSLNNQNASQIQAPFWMWIALYAFSLQIYLDFSGYTDIAIGMGELVGIHLPENFLTPYLKTNLVLFWNSWHITLSQWFRAYYFYPFTRKLRQHSVRLPVWGIIFLGQISTMGLIGIWHGFTINFLIWGLWHGFGLFLNNRWSEWVRLREWMWIQKPMWKNTLQFGSWILTFHFITLGWVWFATSDPLVATWVYLKLLGV